jgi:predicted transcriptional regulator
MMGGVIPREEWIDLANYQVWRLLKILQNSKEATVRQIILRAGGSPNTNLAYLYTLARWGLVKYQEYPPHSHGGWRKVFYLTPLGLKLLEYYDGIGEIAKKINTLPNIQKIRYC